MAEICIKIPNELKESAEKFNLDLNLLVNELVKREIVKKEIMRRINSHEEKDLEEWSVELGKKAKKDSFKRLLSELTPKERDDLLSKVSPEKGKGLIK
jgi:hypothetical protein